jgi:hypothetical protein
MIPMKATGKNRSLPGEGEDAIALSEVHLLQSSSESLAPETEVMHGEVMHIWISNQLRRSMLRSWGGKDEGREGGIRNGDLPARFERYNGMDGYARLKIR